MKRPVILVTGFGAFPGAPHNPTAVLMRMLAAHEGRLARLGVKLERRILPVVYDEIEPRLKCLIADIAPDAILHFGLAGRRRKISIETRALNRLGALHPDAASRNAKSRNVLPQGEMYLRGVGVPAGRLNATLRQSGIMSELSINAGDYVCNQTFYLSLAMAANTGRAVGFIHVPKLKSQPLVKAALLLIMALVPDLRRQRQNHLAP
jgi:pyroglutamyl-peptidase